MQVLLGLQAKELLRLEEFRSGDMPQALGRAFLRMDELLVQEKHLEELKTLAGPKEKRYRTTWRLVRLCLGTQAAGFWPNCLCHFRGCHGLHAKLARILMSCAARACSVRPRWHLLICNDQTASRHCGRFILLLVKGTAELPMVPWEVLAAGSPLRSTTCPVTTGAHTLQKQHARSARAGRSGAA